MDQGIPYFWFINLSRKSTTTPIETLLIVDAFEKELPIQNDIEPIFSHSREN